MFNTTIFRRNDEGERGYNVQRNTQNDASTNYSKNDTQKNSHTPHKKRKENEWREIMEQRNHFLKIL